MFNPGAYVQAIPLLQKLWPEGTVMRRVGAEADAIGIYGHMDSLDDDGHRMKRANRVIADDLDPMIIPGSPMSFILKRKINDIPTSNIQLFMRLTFNSAFDYQDSENAIKEICEIQKCSFAERLCINDNGPIGVFILGFDSMDEYADSYQPIDAKETLRKNHIFIRSKIRDNQMAVWKKCS